MRRRRREVFAEWFRVKGTGKVRREKEHCRDGSGTREVFAEWFRVKGTGKVRREKEHCRDGSGTGESGNKFPYSICGFACRLLWRGEVFAEMKLPFLSHWPNRRLRRRDTVWRHAVSLSSLLQG